jgi:hypothetical protein
MIQASTTKGAKIMEYILAIWLFGAIAVLFGIYRASRVSYSDAERDAEAREQAGYFRGRK